MELICVKVNPDTELTLGMCIVYFCLMLKCKLNSGDKKYAVATQFVIAHSKENATSL